MVIVESHREWKKFIVEFRKQNSIVIPIQCDENKHPLDTNLCLLYVKLLDGNLEEYVLPFRHSDAINLKDKYIKKTSTDMDVFTYDKKKLLHFVKWDNVIDMQMHYYMSKNEPLNRNYNRILFSKFYDKFFPLFVRFNYYQLCASLHISVIFGNVSFINSNNTLAYSCISHWEVFSFRNSIKFIIA